MRRAAETPGQRDFASPGSARHFRGNSQAKTLVAARYPRRQALDLDAGVFSFKDPREIALSLKRSALRSTRRKSDPFRSAMSMLNFYINRAGKGLSRTQLNRLEAAKEELRDVFGKDR